MSYVFMLCVFKVCVAARVLALACGRANVVAALLSLYGELPSDPSVSEP